MGYKPPAVEDSLICHLTVHNRTPTLALLVMFCIVPLSSRSIADSPARQAATFASGAGTVIYLGAAIGLPLLDDGSDGRNHALRITDSIGTSFIVSEGLDAIVREKRPDSNAHDSFPSSHAAVAFAAATAISGMHPKQAPYWFAGAAAIGYSRIRLNEHYPRDVLAGALIGFGIARLELSSPRGLLLAPVIQPANKSIGLLFNAAW